MATHKSAVKAHRQNLKHRERNRQYRARLRNALRAIRAAVRAGELEKARGTLPETIALIDRMVGKRILHANAAGRYKSRLMKQLAKTAA